MWAREFSSKPAVQAVSGAAGWTRALHRLIAPIFVATVIANFVVMAFRTPPAWVTYSPLPPLFVLMGSGSAMWVRQVLLGGRSVS